METQPVLAALCESSMKLNTKLEVKLKLLLESFFFFSPPRIRAPELTAVYLLMRNGPGPALAIRPKNLKSGVKVQPTCPRVLAESSP